MQPPPAPPPSLTDRPPEGFGVPSAGLVAQRGRDFARLDYLALGPTLDRRWVPQLPHPAQILATRLAAFLAMPSVRLFASGTQAILQGLGAVLSPNDVVIADVGNHPAVVEAVRSAGAGLLLAPAGSVEGIERRLARLARQRTFGSVWVAVPAISGHASVMADLADLAELCGRFGARLIVDVTHDLGVMGQHGRGVAELQGCLGRADVVLGSLAPTFATPGGFLALQDLPRLAVQPPSGSALPDALASRVLSALGQIEGAEGRRKRRALHGAVLRLRNQLFGAGIAVMGHPSPLVPIRLPADHAIDCSALAQSAGFAIPLLQAPAVPGRSPRWRIQLSASHGLADIDILADLVIDICRTPFHGRSKARVSAIA